MSSERQALDLHFMWFPPVGPYEWRVVKCEERLADERLSKEVVAMKVNRSERRASTSPAPLVRVRVEELPVADLRACDKRVLCGKQLSVFLDEGTVKSDGSRRRH